MVVANSVAQRVGALRRLLVILLAAGVAVAGWGIAGSATTGISTAAVPRAHCGPGSLPETSTQGRVPASDYTSGRVAQGYRCTHFDDVRYITFQHFLKGLSRFFVPELAEGAGNSPAYFGMFFGSESTQQHFFGSTRFNYT